MKPKATRKLIKQKILIFIVAYNAEKTIRNVIDRIPRNLKNSYRCSLLIIDDCSQDSTYNLAKVRLNKGFWCSFHVLKNEKNLGYGGNQKLGYHFAINNNYDYVILLHGDGQYPPEQIISLLKPFHEKNQPDAVFGSRMLNWKDAIKGGMPLYKFIGNKILTKIQNYLLSSNLSEFHSGFRAYKVSALKELPFHLNTNDFHFDTEIILQLFSNASNVKEIPIPTYYGDEICHVNGLRYAWDVIKASIKTRIMRMGIFYDPKFAFDKTLHLKNINKIHFKSTHTVLLKEIENQNIVINLSKLNETFLKETKLTKKCKIYNAIIQNKKNIDFYGELEETIANISLPWESADEILMIDLLEHLRNPEAFLAVVRNKLNGNTKAKVIISAGNISFFINRLMMVIGHFNYAQYGILDITHIRLFTPRSLKRTLKYAGFNTIREVHLPGPYPLALGLNKLSKSLIILNDLLIKVTPNLFSYQVMHICKAQPDTDWLLKEMLNKTLE